MGILFQYFLRFYVGQLLKVTIGLSLVIFLIDIVELSRRTTSLSDFTFFELAALAALRVPSFLVTIAPFFILFAGMMSLLTLNKRQELVITRASGLSAWQFVAPFCAGAFAVGLMLVTLFNPLATAAFAWSEDIQIEIGLSPPAGGNIVPWFRQPTEQGSLIIGADQASSGGTLLGAPRFFYFDKDNNLLKRVDAQSGALIEGNWVLKNALVFVEGQEAETVAEFVAPSLVDVEKMGQSLTPPTTVSFFNLPQSILTARAFGLPDAPYAMRWHSLLALPALLVAMTLIAATVSLRFARFGQNSAAILGGILAGFLLYVVTAMAEALGSAGAINPVFAAWLPVIAASFFGVTFLLYKEDG
jgi:lipopolysaccharide export system permease protein